MGVTKFEMRVVRLQFLPQFPDPEISVPHIYVMEQNDGTLRQLRLPATKILCSGFVRVKTVDVQQVDAAILEPCNRLVEGRPKQFAAAVSRGNEIADREKHHIPIYI